MPFQSSSQRAWMFKNKPELAKQFEDETAKNALLPDHVPSDAHLSARMDFYARMARRKR